ncbi:MAG: hypothetical protein JNN08_23410 [Bryobacterales bacterium]|nr:hypothetical protein [Bryobacterales bacterium]
MRGPYNRLAWCCLVAFGFLIVWITGHWGINVMDHSILFDGGYRIYQGQVPYKDFFMAYPPGTLWVQALFFGLWGLDFSALVLPAALANAAGVGMAMGMTLKLFPQDRLAAAVSGLFTAVWFLGPFGALQHEQLAFLFDFAALWLIVRWPAPAARAGAGLALACAMLCKQNAGGMFVPVVLSAVVLQQMPQWRRIAFDWLLLGVTTALGLGAFALWVCFYSDWTMFVLHAVRIPSSFGLLRLLAHPAATLESVLRFGMPGPLYPLGLPLAALVLAGFVHGVRKGDVTIRLAGGLAFTFLIFSALFQVSALNDRANSLPFLGLVCGWGLAMARRMNSKRLPLAAALLMLPLGVAGLAIDLVRAVHQPKPVDYSEKLSIPAMRRVSWANPTYIGEFTISRQEWEGLYNYLMARPGNFFIFPDATIFYGITGRPSPQPLLYFVRGHSFADADIPRVDAAILASLQHHNIQTFVWEERTFMHTANTLTLFPQTNAWLHTNFHKTRNFGIFQVWERLP